MTNVVFVGEESSCGGWWVGGKPNLVISDELINIWQYKLSQRCTFICSYLSSLLLYQSSSFFLTGNRFAAAPHGNIAENFLQILSVGTFPLHRSHLTIHSDIIIINFCLHLLLPLTTFTSDMLLVWRSGGHWHLTQSHLQKVDMWGAQGSDKQSSSFACTVTESFTEQETECSLHHMVMFHSASFNMYQFLVVFQTGWSFSTTCYGSLPYCKPAGETP